MNKLSEESKELMDANISIEEVKKSLLKMKNNKSPGPDGICTEFYKLFGIALVMICMLFLSQDWKISN